MLIDKATGKGCAWSIVSKTITKKLARLHPQFKEGDVLTPEYIEALSEEDQEVADQINRRTEFQVLSIDYNIF